MPAPSCPAAVSYMAVSEAYDAAPPAKRDGMLVRALLDLTAADLRRSPPRP